MRDGAIVVPATLADAWQMPGKRHRRKTLSETPEGSGTSESAGSSTGR